jgi:lipooligosaccharide transport system permease protein
MRSWQDFDLIQHVILPMFLFSGTFYPLDAYPEPVRLIVQATPLYQGVDLLRSLAVGTLGVDDVVHVVYLLAMGIGGLLVVSRRLDRLLLK